MRRNILLLALLAALILFASSLFAAPQNDGAVETIQVDDRAKGVPFPHYWERMFGSGRAILSLPPHALALVEIARARAREDASR